MKKIGLSLLLMTLFLLAPAAVVRAEDPIVTETAPTSAEEQGSDKTDQPTTETQTEETTEATETNESPVINTEVTIIAPVSIADISSVIGITSAQVEVGNSLPQPKIVTSHDTVNIPVLRADSPLVTTVAPKASTASKTASIKSSVGTSSNLTERQRVYEAAIARQKAEMAAAAANHKAKFNASSTRSQKEADDSETTTINQAKMVAEATRAKVIKIMEFFSWYRP